MSLSQNRVNFTTGGCAAKCEAHRVQGQRHPRLDGEEVYILNECQKSHWRRHAAAITLQIDLKPFLRCPWEQWQASVKQRFRQLSKRGDAFEGLQAALEALSTWLEHYSTDCFCLRTKTCRPVLTASRNSGAITSGCLRMGTVKRRPRAKSAVVAARVLKKQAGKLGKQAPQTRNGQRVHVCRGSPRASSYLVLASTVARM